MHVTTILNGILMDNLIYLAFEYMAKISRDSMFQIKVFVMLLGPKSDFRNLNENRKIRFLIYN